MIIICCIVAYIAISFAFCWWDAAIGFAEDMDGYNAPPLWVCALFWPISIPILTMIAISNFFDATKQKRLNREEKQQKIRLAVQKEAEEIENQIDKELSLSATKK